MSSFAGTFAPAAARFRLLTGEDCAVAGRLDPLAHQRQRDVARPDVSASDIVATGFGRGGRRCLESLRGVFALAVWEPATGTGLLAVDQLGGGALFFAESAGELVFATEIADILGLLPRRPDPNEAAVVQWLADGSSLHGETLFAGIRRLEGGHCLELTSSGWRKVRYWEPRFRPPLQVARQEAAEILREAASRAIAAAACAGAPSGVLLSGGLDSSSVAALALRGPCVIKESVSAYSAVFPGHTSVDESGLIDALIRSLGITGRRLDVEVGPVLLPSLDFLERWALPSFTPNVRFMVPLAQMAAEDGIGILLDGEGGDELFGCVRALIAHRLRQGRPTQALRLARELPTGFLPTRRIVRRLLREYGAKTAMPHFMHVLARRLRGPGHYAPGFLTERHARTYLDSKDPWSWKRGKGPLWWRFLAYQLTVSREEAGAHDLLRRLRAMAGIQGGHPYLQDLDLIECVLQLPPELAFDAKLSRPLFRESLTGLLPDAIRLRSTKANFTSVVEDCITGPDFSRLSKLLSAPNAEINVYLRPGAVRAMLDDPRPPALWRLWDFAVLECWLQTQADPAFVERTREAWATTNGVAAPRAQS